LRLKQRQLDDLLFRFESREHLQDLRDEITALESRLRNDTSRNESKDSVPDWKAVQATLPPNSAFVEFVRYDNFAAALHGPRSYGAVLILPDGDPRWIPLGTEEELRTWLGVMKERLDYRAYVLSSRRSVAPPALRLRSALHRIHDRFWGPIAKQLPPGTETLGISPDGSLNFVSFAVLLDEQEQFLADTFRQIVYLSSGRDLLVNATRPALREGPWAVVAVPDFEARRSEDDPGSASALDRAVLETIDSFPSVPGAREELKRLHRIIPPEARGVELMNASEQDLRNLTTSPVVLHLTTHAFFLPAVQDGGPSGVQDFDQQPDRLYRSGLVLTEAKRALAERVGGAQVPFDQDGVLFSDEATTLPLHNTRLVTLSSCESGLGEAVSGEGVLGLRRGFTLAGTTNILISLWPVSDNSTPKFMESMYRLSLATDRVGQSLWETQRRAFEEVDPRDDAELEEAILRYGCFVLCQRGPLQSAVPMPVLKKSFEPWWLAALAVTGAFLFLITRPITMRNAK